MIAVVQRCLEAAVRVDGRTVGRVDHGLAVFVGIVHGDGPRQVEWIARKLATLRVFSGADGRMDRSVLDEQGAVLLVPNFTVAARVGKGTRPDFGRALAPQAAFDLFEQLRDAVAAQGVEVATGEFGADMRVDVAGDGPVTMVLERPPTDFGGEQ